MPHITGGDELQELLLNSAGVTSLVSNYTYSSTTKYCIFNDTNLPETLKTDTGYFSPSINDVTINHFAITPREGGMRFGELQRQLSCRAGTKKAAEELAEAVYNATNGITYNGVNFTADFQPVIGPADNSDNYNCPVILREKIK